MGKYASKFDLGVAPVEFDWEGKTYHTASLTSGGWADWRRALRLRNWLEAKINALEAKLRMPNADESGKTELPQDLASMTREEFDKIDGEVAEFLEEQINLDANMLCGVIPGMTVEIVKTIPLVSRSRLLQEITSRESKETKVAEEEVKSGES